MTRPLVIELPRPVATVEVARPPEPAADGSGTAGAGAAAATPLPDPREAEARIEQERQALSQARAALLAATEAVQALETDIVEAAESQLVDLALTIAQKVIAQEIEAGRHRIEPIVREALRHAPSRRDIVVHLNPQDLAQCQQGTPAPWGSNVKLVADPSVRRAECLVETVEGTVQATVAERLDAVAETLKPPG